VAESEGGADRARDHHQTAAHAARRLLFGGRVIPRGFDDDEGRGPERFVLVGVQDEQVPTCIAERITGR
jgi:hypothetical protein